MRMRQNVYDAAGVEVCQGQRIGGRTFTCDGAWMGASPSEALSCETADSERSSAV